MYDPSPWDPQPRSTLRHRPIDLANQFEQEDLEQYARGAELAAENFDLDLVDLSELYGAADTTRAAARLGGRRKRRQG